MRRGVVQQLVAKAKDGPAPDPRVVRELGMRLVALYRCTRLRPKCSHEVVSIRTADELVDAGLIGKCPKCGGKLLASVREAWCVVEANAPAGIVRWRPVDYATGDPLGTGEWTYRPFSLDAPIEKKS